MPLDMHEFKLVLRLEELPLFERGSRKTPKSPLWDFPPGESCSRAYCCGDTAPGTGSPHTIVSSIIAARHTPRALARCRAAFRPVVRAAAGATDASKDKTRHGTIEGILYGKNPPNCPFSEFSIFR